MDGRCMDLGIKGKKVLVTGASQGIGAALARAFAKEGCHVSVIARREEKLKALVQTLGGRESGHDYYAADLMTKGKAACAIDRLTRDGKPFEIVIHNIGGTLNLKEPLAKVEEWNKVWQFNVGIAIELNELLIPPMKEIKWGRVIHISSISAESVRGSTPYAASKAYLNAYVKGIGRSFAMDGIVITALMPGALYSKGGHWDNLRKTQPAIEKDFLRHHHAIGRLGRVDEITPFALFMASQQATFAPASVVPIDGGTM